MSRKLKQKKMGKNESLIIQVPGEWKSYLIDLALKLDISLSELVRSILAEHIPHLSRQQYTVQKLYQIMSESKDEYK